MRDDLKTKVIPALIILTVILLISSVGSCSNANRQKTERAREMSKRLDLEENMSKERSILEGKVKDLEKQLKEEQAANDAMKKALVQEQMVSQSLKNELQKSIKK